MQELLKYCDSDIEIRNVEALIKANGNKSRAAKDLGINLRGLQRSLKLIEVKAAANGYAPDNDLTKTTAPGNIVKRVSTNYGEDGEIKQQWVIQEPEKQKQLDAILDALDNKIDSLPKIPNIAKPKSKPNKELCTVYTITDFHIGMLAWDKETGDDWDCDIAHRVLLNTFRELIQASPDSEIGIFNQLGDFLHWDGLEAVTPSSGHVLDADSRYAKIVELAIDLCIEVVGMMLRKHKKVRVVIAEGNHDLSGSVWLQKCLKKLFANNKRVEIDDSAFPFYAYKHGDIMLGFHHGHKVKNKSLPALFASEPRYRQMWGEAKYTYIHTGHYHTTEQDMAEGGGAIVERHPTLASRDAYAARGGWVSWRQAKAITYHVSDGESRRVQIPPRG